MTGIVKIQTKPSGHVPFYDIIQESVIAKVLDCPHNTDSYDDSIGTNFGEAVRHIIVVIEILHVDVSFNIRFILGPWVSP